MSHFIKNHDEQVFDYQQEPKTSLLEYIGNKIDDIRETHCDVETALLDIRNQIQNGFSATNPDSLAAEVRTLRRAKVLGLAMELMEHCPGKTLQECLSLVNSYVLNTKKEWMGNIK